MPSLPPKEGFYFVPQEAIDYIKEVEAERDALREALEKIDQPGRPEPERGIARAALERHS